MIRRIALVTCDQYPNLVPQEQGLIALFEQKEVQAVQVVWTEPEIDWLSFDAIIIRSVWDYHLRYSEFLQLLDKLEAENLTVLNPTKILRANSHKSYLRAVQASGLQIAPTTWYSANETRDLKAEMINSGWSEAVLKPCVSASAHNTFRIPTQIDDAQAAVNQHAYPHGFMLQKFMPEIQQAGEWSMMFLNGKYSHSVLKSASRGEYRVQHEYGGQYTLLQPPESIVKQAKRILDSFEGQQLYARIDGIERKKKFVLMEAELIEPYLFLETLELQNRFVQSVLDRLPRAENP